MILCVWLPCVVSGNAQGGKLLVVQVLAGSSHVGCCRAKWKAAAHAKLGVVSLLHPRRCLVFLLKLGLRTPSEPTQAILTSLLILRDGDDRKGRSADGMRSLFCTLEFEQWHSCCFEMLVCLARISNLEPTLFDFC